MVLRFTYHCNSLEACSCEKFSNCSLQKKFIKICHKAKKPVFNNTPVEL